VVDRGQDRLKKVVRLKMTSKGRVCLRLADVKRYRVPILGAATWKARSPNESSVMEQKVSDWQMNAWTLRACDIV